MSRLEDITQRAILELAARKLKAFRVAVDEAIATGITPSYDNPLGQLPAEGYKATATIIDIAQKEFMVQAEQEVLHRFQKLLLNE